MPLPVGEIGTHAVKDLVEHTHAVRSSPQNRYWCATDRSPASLVPLLLTPLYGIKRVARAADGPDHRGRRDLGPERGDVHVSGPVAGRLATRGGEQRSPGENPARVVHHGREDRRSEEHTSELQSL